MSIQHQNRFTHPTVSALGDTLPQFVRDEMERDPQGSGTVRVFATMPHLHIHTDEDNGTRSAAYAVACIVVDDAFPDDSVLLESWTSQREGDTLSTVALQFANAVGAFILTAASGDASNG